MASTSFASTTLIKSFQALYNKREESANMDFTVVCQDDSEIPVHSAVLSASSDVLEMALTGEFKESHEKKIHLKTYDPKSVQQFIRFLYGFELEQNDLQIAKDLTVMGGVYNIPSLQEAAAEALVDHVNMNNLVEIMDFVKINSVDSAADALGNQVVKNFDREQLISSDVLMKHPEIAVKLLKALPVSSSSTPSASVVLTSTGPSAEYRGCCLGVFDYIMQYNNSPAYRQRHSVANPQPQYLYRDEDGDWCVSYKLGSSLVSLLNRTKIDTVPSTNWLHAYGKDAYGKARRGWSSDTELTISTSLSSISPVINISLQGETASENERALQGEYKPTGEWSAGHPVYGRYGRFYLCVKAGRTSWSVSSSLDNTEVILQSGSVAWCPTSLRSSWQYWKYGEWHDGEIQVSQDN